MMEHAYTVPFDGMSSGHVFVGFFLFKISIFLLEYAAAAAKSLQLCPTLCDPARLLCLWDSSGENTGVGCHCLLGSTILVLIKRQ